MMRMKEGGSIEIDDGPKDKVSLNLPTMSLSFISVTLSEWWQFVYPVCIQCSCRRNKICLPDLTREGISDMKTTEFEMQTPCVKAVV